MYKYSHLSLFNKYTDLKKTKHDGVFQAFSYTLW